MQLIIKQKKFSFLIDQYEIYEYDNVLYTASTVFFSFPRKLKVFDLSDNNILTITKSLTFIHPKFEINFSQGTKLTLEGKSWLYDYFTLKIPEGLLEIHHQKGLKLSIFLNNEQIAEIIKTNVIKIFKGDEYQINANSNISKELLTAICLAWDMNDFNNDSNTLTFNFGNIGPVKKKSISNWKPYR
jgi:uncharacterized protein YxjI